MAVGFSRASCLLVAATLLCSSDGLRLLHKEGQQAELVALATDLDVTTKKLDHSVESTEALQFVIGSPDTMGCPGARAPLTMTECEEAASYLGKDWTGSDENRSTAPVGCYIFDQNIVRFNIHPRGGTRTWYAPVCKTQAELQYYTGANNSDACPPGTRRLTNPYECMKAAAYYGKATGSSCESNTTEEPAGCFETPQFKSSTRFCFNHRASGGAHPQARPICLIELCLDISDTYMVDGSSNDVKLSQDDCAGTSSDGWSYTVKGRVATMDNGITGEISGSRPLYTIVWSNGFTYTSSKLHQFRHGSKGSTACPDGTAPLTLQECAWADRAYGKAGLGEELKAQMVDWLPPGCVWNNNSRTTRFSYNYHESGGSHYWFSQVCKVVS